MEAVVWQYSNIRMEAEISDVDVTERASDGTPSFSGEAGISDVDDTERTSDAIPPFNGGEGAIDSDVRIDHDGWGAYKSPVKSEILLMLRFCHTGRPPNIMRIPRCSAVPVVCRISRLKREVSFG
jgi:hypothetical protein